MIERSVILAEGAKSAAILSWIADHDGIEEARVASKPTNGLHGARLETATRAAPAPRFVLPARAFHALPRG